MLASNAVAAVLFAKDLRRVAPFYRAVMNAGLLDAGANHETLDCGGFHLVIHQIPGALANSIEIANPPVRREATAIRLDFPVADINRARQHARRLGGEVDDQPPPWAVDSGSIYLGFDPEGNVFGLLPASVVSVTLHE